jgi:hypothetical protein
MFVIDLSDTRVVVMVVVVVMVGKRRKFIPVLN